MSKITIEVDSKHQQKVLTLLNQLKPELIKSITTEGSAQPVKSSLNKYSKEKYKQKVQQKVENDEFLAPSKGGKYLSPSAYKTKLQGK